MPSKKDQVYTMKIELKGQPRTLTIRVTDNGMEVMLTDDKGNEIEYFKQEGKEIKVAGPGAVLKKR